jgi:guanylate kinase
MSKYGKLVLIIGPSGVGKSAILRSLRDAHPEFVFPRSATTRERRPGEGDELYHFVSEEDFTTWMHEGKFLETAQVHKGARYGTLFSEIVPPIESGKTVVREVDAQGFQSIARDPLFGPGGTYTLQTIFILPESPEQLVEQIQKRAPMAKEELDRRLASMREELKCAAKTDMQITNPHGKLEQTIAAVEKAIVG